MRREGSVGRLLTRAFGGLVALVVGCGAVELGAVLVEHHAERELAAEVQPLRLANAELRTVLTDAQAGLRGYALTGDGRMLDAYELARSEYGVASDELPDDQGHEQIARADAWWAVAEQQRQAAPGSAEAIAYAEREATLFRAFAAANDAVRDAAEERAVDLRDRADGLRWLTVMVILLLTVVIAIAAALTAIRTRRQIVEPLTEVVAGEGRQGPAEIRAIADALDAAEARTEEMRRAEELVSARLREIETVKSDFMSTVSHELRTPLTSISGYVELMRDAEPGQLSASQERMLEVIARNARRLRDLIEDILTLSRIESGDFRTLRGPLDLAEVVLRGVAAVEPIAAKSSVRLQVDVQGPVPVRGDRAQLDRVLDNLLSNAVKFTPSEGVVTVTAERRGDNAVLVVADTGMGIPEADQEALFGRFFRAGNAIRQAVPGTGLGLAIVHTILGNHDGTIEVRSTENVGTTVTVTIPAIDAMTEMSAMSGAGEG
ncbi:hypothetical protein Ade02nite_46400 [Paractinoplanes deccanensis]|uniref:histidine kinase n=1 Tax=Paractinoplanes deccanensis TaxID=113561 RepID=A0ABQ3Y7P4_9ACTN|nr:ATP-binding protein [Actinoplanes deccanensis]GID75999.1 hypothetical protein Ade02nite_46400 [Actinoplanes deccanensis]